MSSNRTSDDESLPPETPLLYPKFDFDALPYPSDNWEFLGETVLYVIRNRRFQKLRMEELLSHHSWGMDLGLARRVTNDKLARTIWKLFYYMAPMHRPKSYEELFDYRRDAGPRLLKCSLENPTPLPISRYYPHLPSSNQTVGPHYRRPKDAARSQPDAYIEQMLYSVSERPDDGEDDRDDDDDDDDDEDDGDDGDDGDDPDYENNANFKIPQIDTESSSRHVSVASRAKDRHAARPLVAKKIAEAIERTIMSFTCSDLERHPTATPQQARPYKVATSPDDLLKAVIGSFPATATVKLSADPKNIDNMIMHHDGYNYPYRGRGPVWSNNSAAVDCIIVIARFLDAGSTNIDRSKKGWRDLFTAPERALIEAADANWDLCTPSESAQLRDRFWQVVAEVDPAVRVGLEAPLWNIWNLSTHNFSQFRFTYSETVRQCRCKADSGEQSGQQEKMKSSFVIPFVLPEDKKGVTMQELLARTFAPELTYDCSECRSRNSITRIRVLKEPPARLVTTLDGSATVRNHSKDITFEYINYQGQRLLVTYRWLGGIYYRNNHLRVYWNDNKRGEMDAGEIRLYDSVMNLGLVVGGLPQGHRDEKVPAHWWVGSAIPLLVYERVDNVGLEVLTTAMNTVKSMAKVVGTKKLLAEELDSWVRTDCPANAPDWPDQRLLSNAGDRFHESPVPYMPVPFAPPPADPRPQGEVEDVAMADEPTFLMPPATPAMSMLNRPYIVRTPSPLDNAFLQSLSPPSLAQFLGHPPTDASLPAGPSSGPNMNNNMSMDTSTQIDDNSWMNFLDVAAINRSPQGTLLWFPSPSQQQGTALPDQQQQQQQQEGEKTTVETVRSAPLRARGPIIRVIHVEEDDTDDGKKSSRPRKKQQVSKALATMKRKRM
ncbi:hypothetical protein EYZ11_012253 [Aspergillus tanneri]|uniref:Uncharacterized protein n=1 Tax=Aspergillus tanneri TaxID=1220188 RepID=A0A4S3J0P6_9EURO|nr:uncharacterized protein ATNIH1004_002363 [Aspergillus tanneri]KAA8649691.1 hypothetical protein ATNIH1004_002363 [Aspergillus tanneri]THC88299.1 hypothetical protein EYZ11_012253 [Aspergillus tanneri]